MIQCSLVFCERTCLKKRRSTSSVHSPERLATPAPVIFLVSDIPFDFWALRTLRGRCQDVCQFEPYLHALAEWDPTKTYESPKNTESLAARKRTNAITRPFEDP